MGISVEAILAYGYDLGGDGQGWKIEGLDEYREPSFDWYDEDNERFEDAMLRRLAKANGVAVRDDGYVNEDALAAIAGVSFVMYQHADYTSYFLAAFEHTVSMGTSERIDDFEVPNGTDEKLRAAVEAIGIVPTEAPGWYLAPFMG